MPSYVPCLQDLFLRPGISRKTPNVPGTNAVSDIQETSFTLQVNTALFASNDTSPKVK